MKVILLEDVKGVGKKHQIVEVNDGYAKNFLIKKNLAVLETKESLKKLNLDIKHENEVYETTVYEAELLKKQLEQLHLSFSLKSDHHGNAFGKISVKELIDAINKEQKLVNKYMFNTKEWGLGTHEVEIKLHKDVTAKISIEILEAK